MLFTVLMPLHLAIVFTRTMEEFSEYSVAGIRQKSNSWHFTVSNGYAYQIYRNPVVVFKHKTGRAHHKSKDLQ